MVQPESTPNDEQSEITPQQETEQSPLQEQPQQQQQEKPPMKKWQSEGGLDALRQKAVDDDTTEAVSPNTNKYGLRKRKSSGAPPKEEKENAGEKTKRRSGSTGRKGKGPGRPKKGKKGSAPTEDDGAGGEDVASKAPENGDTGMEEKQTEKKEEDDKSKKPEGEEAKKEFVFTTMEHDDLSSAGDLDPTTAPTKVNIIKPDAPMEGKGDAAEDEGDDTLTGDDTN